VRDRQLVRTTLGQLRRKYSAVYRDFWDRVERGERAT
jgi:hypothetical protein